MNERILIVDDDESIIFMLTRALEKSGYQVQGSLDGQEGMQALVDSPPFAVLLTDLMMPGMSGLDLIRSARELDPYLEIIVITAAGSIESAITAMRDGNAYDYLLKPLESMQHLSAIVERAIAHRRLVLERAALQNKMETEATRLQMLIGSVSEAILAASPNGVITVANPAAARLLGREDLVGNPALSVLPPKLANIVENWQVIGGQYPASLEIHLKQDSIQMVSLTPLPERSGDRLGWAMVLRDVTPLKRSDKLKTQALSEAIGKIRLPLAEAMNAVVDLNLRLPQDERIAESLFQLNSVWERIQTWGDELLTVVKGGAERNVRPTSVDPQEALEAIQVDQAVRLYTQGGGRLSVHLSSPLPPVLTDADMLQRLLQSLVKRATMRSPQNGEIRIHAREHKGQVWIEINDEGPAVSASNLMQIFDKSVADLATGSLKVGLELVRAKTILDRLDGQLWIGGKGPRGSTIIICLPALPSSPTTI